LKLDIVVSKCFELGPTGEDISPMIEFSGSIPSPDQTLLKKESIAHSAKTSNFVEISIRLRYRIRTKYRRLKGDWTSVIST